MWYLLKAYLSDITIRGRRLKVFGYKAIFNWLWFSTTKVIEWPSIFCLAWIGGSRAAEKLKVWDWKSNLWLIKPLANKYPRYFDSETLKNGITKLKRYFDKGNMFILQSLNSRLPCHSRLRPNKHCLGQSLTFWENSVEHRSRVKSFFKLTTPDHYLLGVSLYIPIAIA